jgi:hypothetical protein
MDIIAILLLIGRLSIIIGISLFILPGVLAVWYSGGSLSSEIENHPKIERYLSDFHRDPRKTIFISTGLCEIGFSIVVYLMVNGLVAS